MASARLPRRLVRWSAAFPALIAAASLPVLLPPSDPPPPGAPSSPPAVAPAATSPDVLVLRGDRRLAGEVLREGADHLVVRLADGDVRLVSRADVVGRERLAPPRTGPAVTVRLRSGRVVDGALLAEGPDAMELRLRSGTTVVLRRADVAGVDRR